MFWQPKFDSNESTSTMFLRECQYDLQNVEKAQINIENILLEELNEK